MNRRVALLIFLSLTLPINAPATIINVPGNQPSIQAGINAAISGDTVLVQPNTYTELITYKARTRQVANSHRRISPI